MFYAQSTITVISERRGTGRNGESVWPSGKALGFR